MYIAEEAFKKAGIKANIQYHTALPGIRQNIHPDVFLTFVLQYINTAFLHSLVLFGVKKYADALWEVVKGRWDFSINLKHILKPQAHFET